MASPQKSVADPEIQVRVTTVRDDIVATVPEPALPRQPGQDPVEYITFSRKIWTDQYEPEQGQLILVKGVRRFNKGWRAASARPITIQASVPAQGN